MKTHKIYGPPGTGKTTRALDILKEKIGSGIPVREIAYITFTKTAIAEAKHRIRINFPSIDEKELKYFRTLHSLCYEELGIIKEQVVDKVKLKEFAEEVGENITISSDYHLDVITDADEVLSTYNAMRNRLDECFNYNGRWNKYRCDWLIRSYETWKKENEFLDFTDFLYNYNFYGDPVDCKIAIIDEAQDLSILQKQVVKKLFQNADKMYILGDDDQAIYNWAGADAQSFLDWEADTEEILHHSYRLPLEIKLFSEKIIKNVANRKEKIFGYGSKIGNVERLFDISPTQSKDCVGEDTFILFRNRYFAKAIAQRLEFLKIPYSGAGSPFDNKKEIEAIQTYESLKQGEWCIVRQMQKVLKYDKNTFKENYRKEMLKRTDYNEVVNNQIRGFHGPWWDYLKLLTNYNFYRNYDIGDLLKPPTIKLMTIHQAKGMEADTVYVLPDMSRRTYNSYLINPDNEHRLFYVAATRAKKNLIWLYNRTERYYR